MNELSYTVFGFAAGLGLLVLYAMALWWGHRAVSRRMSVPAAPAANTIADHNSRPR